MNEQPGLTGDERGGAGSGPGSLLRIGVAWGAVSGTLLLAEGLRLRRFART